MLATGPDLLRLLVVPVFCYVAILDIRTRRVSATIWYPLIALGTIALVWDGYTHYTWGDLTWTRWQLQTALSLLIVAPLGYLFWKLGTFGKADAKALITLAIVFPTIPVYAIGDTVIPLVWSSTGVFSITILVNGTLLGLAYPLALALRNLLSGHLRPIMFIGKPIDWRDIESTHGRFLDATDDRNHRGLDLDALRIYLEWQDTTLAELREHPDRFKYPDEPPQHTPVSDGRVQTDGGTDDPWAARAFVTQTDGIYGTRADELRATLECLIERDTVWVSPGIPFLVPLALGLIVAITYGDLFTALVGI